MISFSMISTNFVPAKVSFNRPGFPPEVLLEEAVSLIVPCIGHSVTIRQFSKQFNDCVGCGMAECEWLQQWKRNKKVARSYPRLGAGVSNFFSFFHFFNIFFFHVQSTRTVTLKRGNWVTSIFFQSGQCGGFSM